jgi:two-component system response regulator
LFPGIFCPHEFCKSLKEIIQRMRTKATMATEVHPYQILLAEDSAADVGIVRIALRDQNLNYVLQVATDGEEAIAFIEKADADSKAPGLDLLLLDMHLPHYSGEQILQRLRSTERLAQTPVVVMTASAAPEDEDRAQKNAALYYFRKPSRLQEFIELGEIVREILETTGTGAEARRGEGDEAA